MSPDGPDGQFLADYGLHVDKNEVDHLQFITIMAGSNFGFKNFPKKLLSRGPQMVQMANLGLAMADMLIKIKLIIFKL